jgi:hypothetical protein
MAKSLNDQLEEIDEAISALEDRRTCIIHRMDTTMVTPDRGGKVIQFPAWNRATVRRSGQAVSSGNTTKRSRSRHPLLDRQADKRAVDVLRSPNDDRK